MRIRGLLVALVAFSVACGDDGGDDGSAADATGGGSGSDASIAAGRACFSGVPLDHPTVLTSPAVECPSRVCLHVEGIEPDECTAPCEDVSDCIPSADSACAGAFVCEAPTDEGAYACQRFCVCASSVPVGGFETTCT